jgi:hypothetical protein
MQIKRTVGRSRRRPVTCSVVQNIFYCFLPFLLNFLLSSTPFFFLSSFFFGFFLSFFLFFLRALSHFSQHLYYHNYKLLVCYTTTLSIVKLIQAYLILEPLEGIIHIKLSIVGFLYVWTHQISLILCSIRNTKTWSMSRKPEILKYRYLLPWDIF